MYGLYFGFFDIRSPRNPRAIVSMLQVDLDYKYKTSGDKEIEVNIRNPYSMSTSLNMAGNDGQAVVNWDTNRQDSQVKFDFGFKDTTTSELADRSMRFKVVGSRRTVGFQFGYTAAADRFTNRGELQWDSDPESEFAYEVEASRSSGRYTVNYDAKLKVMSGLMTTTSTFSHKTQLRRKHVTEFVIESTDRLRLSNEVVLTPGGGFTDTFTVQHPKLSQVFSHLSSVCFYYAPNFPVTFSFSDVVCLYSKFHMHYWHLRPFCLQLEVIDN